ncbi:hypothetical protein ME7_00229 [Bartonella birtlesii LL-WM9]|uniref:Uncharacterized protein n=1 Tax=Bartonella birtlesii LL-WM9 TaxID=1094552 RepID=J0YTM6_9HYPH|nr:hypothetical protein ME7_00229 [Bartonella birtlesii LL-WM9]
MIKRFLSETQDGVAPEIFPGKEIDTNFDEDFAGIFK